MIPTDDPGKVLQTFALLGHLHNRMMARHDPAHAAHAERPPATLGSTAHEREATDEDPTEHADGCFPASGSGGVGECRLAWTGITCPVHSCDLHDGVRDESGALPRL